METLSRFLDFADSIIIRTDGIFRRRGSGTGGDS